MMASWCNSSDERAGLGLQIVVSSSSPSTNCPENSALSLSNSVIICPSCGHSILQLHDPQSTAGIHVLPGLPAGVKFDPSDQEILQHLEAKVRSDTRKLHPLIDEFIPTIDGENGICYTHPEKLPGVSRDGQIRHFFHRPSKAYTTGTRKRRKVHTDADDGGETRWHKTGKTRPIILEGDVKGHKKILVLYTNYGRQRKPEKTNWVMHQYHLGGDEEEKDGELVVSKVFYQTQPRQCGVSSGSSAAATIKEATMMGKRSRSNSSSLMQQQQQHDGGVIKNTSFIEYYNPPFLSYNVDVGTQNRDSPPPHHHQLIVPNMAVQHADLVSTSSDFMHLPSNASKGK